MKYQFALNQNTLIGLSDLLQQASGTRTTAQDELREVERLDAELKEREDGDGHYAGLIAAARSLIRGLSADQRIELLAHYELGRAKDPGEQFPAWCRVVKKRLEDFPTLAEQIVLDADAGGTLLDAGSTLYRFRAEVIE